MLLRRVSPRRERRPGPRRAWRTGRGPRAGTGSLRPDAPARRAEREPVVGAAGDLLGGDRGRNTGPCSFHVCALQDCVSLVGTLILGGRYLVHVLEYSFFSVVQNLPSDDFFPPPNVAGAGVSKAGCFVAVQSVHVKPELFDALPRGAGAAG